MAYVVTQDDGAAARPDPVPISRLPFHAVGGQPAFAPDDLERFVSKPRIAVLAYLRADGRPHQSPIWYTYRDGSFSMTTTTGSPKHKALARDSRVSVTIQDEAPPYRAVIMEGTVELAPLDSAADPAADSAADSAADPTAGMAVRYFGRLGANAYDEMTAELYAATGLTLITFRPSVVRGFDNTKALGRATLAFVRVRDRLPIPRRWL